MDMDTETEQKLREFNAEFPTTGALFSTATHYDVSLDEVYINPPEVFQLMVNIEVASGSLDALRELWDWVHRNDPEEDDVDLSVADKIISKLNFGDKE